MSEQPAPTLSAEERERWRREIAAFRRAHVSPISFEALCVAVAERLAWLEAERGRLVAENAEQWARLVRAAMDPSEEAMERDRVALVEKEPTV